MSYKKSLTRNKFYRHALEGQEEPTIPIDPQFLEDFAFALGGFRLWVHGRQFPEVADGGYDDWLYITARYESYGASVWTTGPVVQTADLHSFLSQLKAMYKDLRGSAVLKPLEPNLKLSLDMRKNGTITFCVNITPDHMTQNHQFEDGMDQTYLPSAIRGLQHIVDQFPIS